MMNINYIYLHAYTADKFLAVCMYGSAQMELELCTDAVSIEPSTTVGSSCDPVLGLLCMLSLSCSRGGRK